MLKETFSEIEQEKKTKTKSRKKPTVAELPGYEKHMDSYAKKNVYYQESSTTINEDGELLENSFKTISKTKEDDFIKLYLSDLGYLHQLQPNQQELLYYFLKKMTYDNYIIINKTVKEMIAEESNKAYRTVENALTSYVDSGILLRKGRGTYIANPYLFGKGRFEDIQKIRMEIIYTAEGIKLKSQINKSDQNENN